MNKPIYTMTDAELQAENDRLRRENDRLCKALADMAEENAELRAKYDGLVAASRLSRIRSERRRRGMPEEERAAAQEQEAFKLHSCKHKNCKYRATSNNAYGVYSCDYALVTGHTRAAQHPPDKRQPADCMLYEPRTGKKPRRKPFTQTG